MVKEAKNPPIATHRDGAVSAKVWRNFSKDGDPFYSVTFQRTYTDPQNGEPRETNSFIATDVLKVQQLAGEAYRTINHERRQEKRYARAQDGQAPAEEQQAQQQQGLAPQREAAFDAAAPQQGRGGRERAPDREPDLG